MSFKDFLFRRPKPPSMPKPGPPKPRPISLRQAPAYQPLATTTALPIDAKIAELWLAFQSQHGTHWDQFIAGLERDIQTQATQLADLREKLANYRPTERFVP